MPAESFSDLMSDVAGRVAGRPLNADLESFLNETYPPDGAWFQAVEQACHEAIEAGWMCEREHGGIRFGRVIKPTPELHGFSVDVVRMHDIAGPHHRHPNGEIDMIMPITPEAKFDGTGRGWKVYEPDSAHSPTVSDGDALVLYLLPDGAIDFTR